MEDQNNDKPKGYRKLIVWQNTYKLRKIIYDLTKRFPKAEYRRISQMRDAARSVKQNIQEGYNGGSIGKYIQGLNISKGSLAELLGDVEDCFEDDLVKKQEFKLMEDLIKRTDYLLFKLIKSLADMRRKGTWRNFAKEESKKIRHIPPSSFTTPSNSAVTKGCE